MKLWQKRLALVCVSTLLTLGIAEVGVRKLRPQPGYDYPRGMFVADADTGYRIAPDFDGVMKTVGLNVEIKTNRDGFRGPPLRSASKPRILVLGDSFAFGYSVAYEDTIAVHLSNILSPAFPQVEIITAAAPGWGPHEQAAFARRILPQLKPDLLIHLFFCGNDVADALRPPTDRTVFRGRLLSRKIADEHPGIWGALRFEAKRWWEGLHLVRLLQPRTRGEKWASLIHQFHPDTNPQAQAAWKATELGLNRLCDLAKTNAVPLATVAIPALIQVDDERLERFVAGQTPPRELLVWPQKFWQDWARDRGVANYDFTAVCREAHQSAPLYHDWDQHLNATGNRLLGAEIASWLGEEALLTAGD